jgi:hypothetical protein
LYFVPKGSCGKKSLNLVWSRGGGGKEGRRGGIRLLMKQLGNVVGNAHASAVALRSRCNIYELILSGRRVSVGGK